MKDLTVDELRGLAFKFGQTFEREQNDIDIYAASVRLIIQAALDSAERNPEQRAEYSNVALATSYNLSAGCWPAWDETSYNRTEIQLDLGLEAAEFNVELANKLEAGPERRKNGCWIQAAHLACRSEFEPAKLLFEQCRQYAAEAADGDAELMAKGWCLLMDQLLGDQTAISKLDQLKTELRAKGDDGEFYASQYDPFLGYLARSAT